jgi:hypothetical protein
MVVGNNGIDDDKKYMYIAGRFVGHGDAAVRRYVQSPSDHIQGYTGSHWMMPSGECLRRIAPAELPWSSKSVENTKTLTKHNF